MYVVFSHILHILKKQTTDFTGYSKRSHRGIMYLSGRQKIYVTPVLCLFYPIILSRTIDCWSPFRLVNLNHYSENFGGKNIG